MHPLVRAQHAGVLNAALGTLMHVVLQPGTAEVLAADRGLVRELLAYCAPATRPPAAGVNALGLLANLLAVGTHSPDCAHAAGDSDVMSAHRGRGEQISPGSSRCCRRHPV